MRRPDLLLLSTLLWLAAAERASGQERQIPVTSVDDAATAPAGSLRAALEAANDGDTVLFQIETAGQIDLVDTLPTLTGTIALDNSDTSFQAVPVNGPMTGSILVIAPTSTGTLRDVQLIGQVDDMGQPQNDVTLQAADSILVLEVTRADLQLDVPITGMGSLEKTGEMELTLTGANDYTGATTVKTGTLRGNAASIRGDVAVEMGATFVLEIPLAAAGMGDPGTQTYTGNLTGEGVFRKEGAGSLVLTGTVAQPLTTRVEGGVLQAGASTIAGNVAVASGASLRLEQMNDGTYAGVISGAGDLVVAFGSAGAPATLTLTGQNSFTGTARIEAGRVVVSTSNLQATVALGDSTAVEFNQPMGVDGTFAGNITGTGMLVKSGAGKLRLTGSASHSGETDLQQGTLVGNTGNLQGVITAAGGTQLDFEQTSNGTFSGAISSTGDITLRKLGSGTLGISGSQPFSGTTQVVAGALDLARGVHLTSDVDVMAGATLSLGFDFSQATNEVQVGGVAFRDGSTFVVQVDDGELSESGHMRSATLLDAQANPVVINAATLRVVPQPGFYDQPEQFEILRGGSVSGDFASVAPEFVFLMLSTQNAGGALNLTIEPRPGASLEALAASPNQQQLAMQLDDALAGLQASADPNDRSTAANLAILTTDEAPAILDSLTGDELAAFTDARIATAGRFAQSVMKRLDLAQDRGIENLRAQAGGRTPPVAAAFRRGSFAMVELAQRAPELPPVGFGGGPDGGRFAAWVDAYGLFGDVDSDGNFKGIDYKVFGPIVGLDYRLTDHFIVGLAGGYARTIFDTQQADGSGDANTYEGALYLGAVWPHLHAALSGRYARSENETERDIAFGTLTGTARGDFDGDEYGIYFETGYAFGELESIEIQPVASLLWDRVEQESFTETGNTGLELSVQSQDVDTIQTNLGVVATLGRTMEGNYLLHLRLRIAWEHEWGDQERPLTAGFVSGGSNFVVKGAELPRDRAVLDVGWEVGLVEDVNLFVYYDARFGSDFIENGISIGGRFSW